MITTNNQAQHRCFCCLWQATYNKMHKLVCSHQQKRAGGTGCVISSNGTCLHGQHWHVPSWSAMARAFMVSNGTCLHGQQWHVPSWSAVARALSSRAAVSSPALGPCPSEGVRVWAASPTSAVRAQGIASALCKHHGSSVVMLVAPCTPCSC